MEGNENRQVQNGQPIQEGKARKTLLILRRVLAVVLTVLLVVTAVAVVVYRDRLNLDSIKRYLNYQALERNDQGLGVEFAISADKSSSFLSMDDCLIACSSNRIQVYSNGGSLYVDTSAAILNPVMSKEGGYALVYDAGGSELYLFSDRQLIHEYKAASDSAIISARVNKNGWLAIAEEAAGYKASVTVYNDKFQPVLTENISSSFVMDAVVSPDNRQLAVVTLGQDETKFTSTLRIFEFSEGAEQVTQEISDSPTLDLRWSDNGFWLQEQNSLRRMSSSGQLEGAWQDASLHLRGFSLDGDGFAVEYMSRYRSGNVGALFVINEAGEVSAELNLTEEVLSVTAAGRYIGVLTHSEMTIYTSDLNEYAVLEHDGNIVNAMVRSDGTAMLVTENTASVFLP